MLENDLFIERKGITMQDHSKVPPTFVGIFQNPQVGTSRTRVQLRSKLLLTARGTSRSSKLNAVESESTNDLGAAGSSSNTPR